MCVPTLPRNHIISNAFMPITHQSAQVLALRWVRKSHSGSEGLEGAGLAGDCEGVEPNGVWGWDVPSLAHPPKSRMSTMLMTANV
jgi:hypothetical protein